MDKLLLEKISIAGIARVVGISELWLQKYINMIYKNISKIIKNPDVKGKITLECDEMWSFVGNKKDKQWIWLAIDRDSRQIAGVHVAAEIVKGHNHCGIVCLRCIANVKFVIQIFGRHMTP